MKTGRVKTYANKLRRNRVFRELVLTHVAMGINQQRINRLALGNDDSLDVFNLYQKTKKLGGLQPETLSKLELVFKKTLRSSTFWQDMATWLVMQLDTWKDNQQSYSEYEIPAELAIAPDPKKPGEDSWIEARLISILASHLASQLLRQLALETSSVEDLETLLGVSHASAQVTAESAPRLNKPAVELLAPERAPPATVQPFSRKSPQERMRSTWNYGNGEIFLEHQVIQQKTETRHIDLIPGKATWEIMQQLGPEAAYLVLLFAASASDLEPAWKGRIQIHASRLIKLYGWDRKNHWTTTEKFKRISSLVQLVCGLPMSIIQVDLERQLYAVANTQLWLLEKLEYSGPLRAIAHSPNSPTALSPTATVTSEQKPLEPLESLELDEPAELIIRVRVGRWIDYFPNDQGQPATEALRQYGYLAKSTLTINPFHKPLAAKLAIFLTVMSRIQPNGRYRIATLLEALESQEFIESIQDNPAKRDQLIDQWDSALLTLAQLGWEIKFDPRTYPRSLQPSWSQTEGSPTHSQIRPKEWLSQWLAAQTTITPTTLIQHRLEVSKLLAVKQAGFGDETSEADPMGQAPTVIPGYALEMALLLKGFSKAELAKQLNLDRSMVTHWIKGTRPIQPHHREQLWQLLGRELQQATGIRG